jgi:CBS domain-containing protein
MSTTIAFETLTARDVMSRELVRIPQDLSMRDAALLLFHNGISGGPVVDEGGGCVGVLATTDFVALTSRRDSLAPPEEVPARCGFQKRQQGPDGQERVLCTLPLGTCPLQGAGESEDGSAVVVCLQPDSVLSDWQIVELARLPDGAVCHHMTPDPVTVGPDTPIGELARLMADAHIHRLIVVDESRKPIGIVSSTDILTAVAYAGTPPRAV